MEKHCLFGVLKIYLLDLRTKALVNYTVANLTL